MNKIDFEINGFRDCLVFLDDVLPSDQEIEAMKQARYDAWYAIVNAQPEGE